MSVDHGQLDADRFTINCNNGTLVVRRNGEDDLISFKPHDPTDPITKLAPVDYDPAATCPTYDAFLAQVQPKESARRYLHIKISSLSSLAPQYGQKVYALRRLFECVFFRTCSLGSSLRASQSSLTGNSHE